ncbi:TetR/AcrR family transcriptional regulator C-terminal domain-containing protein [Pilosibacter sp. HC1M1C21]
MAKAGREGPRDSVWLSGEGRRGGRRGGQPSGLDRDRITGVTVRLLDTEGLTGFSMRRLAAELNVTAMSVYWYVDTKDQLLELALDAVFGELRHPDPDAGLDWREELRALARENRALLVRHPWSSRLVGTYLNIGPHSLAFSRAVQNVVRRSGLPAHRLTGAISAVFQFVYGYGTIEGRFLARVADTGLSPEEYFQDSMTAVTEVPDTAGVIEDAQDIMAARGGDTVAEMLDRDFEFALDLLVAGIDAMVEQASAYSRARTKNNYGSTIEGLLDLPDDDAPEEAGLAAPRLSFLPAGHTRRLSTAPPTDVSLGDELHLDGEDVAMAHADALDDFDLDMLGDGDSPGPGFTPHDSAPYGALDMADFEFEQMFTDALGIDEYGG